MFPLRPEAPAEATRPLLAPKQGRGHDISAKTAPSGAHPGPREASPAPPPPSPVSLPGRPPVSRAQQRRPEAGPGHRPDDRMDRLSAPELLPAARVSFLSFSHQFFSELLLPFSFLPGPLLILVKVKIILELCDFLHASHTTYDFQTERIPWVTQGRSRKDPPPSRPHGEGCLFSAHALSELLEERGTGLPCVQPRALSFTCDLEGWSPQRSERGGRGSQAGAFPAPPAPLSGPGALCALVQPSRCSGAVLRAVTGEAEGTQTGDLMQTKGGG